MSELPRVVGWNHETIRGVTACTIDWEAWAAAAQAVMSAAAIVVAARLMGLEQRYRREQTVASIVGIGFVALAALTDLKDAAEERSVEKLRLFCREESQNRLRRIARSIAAVPLIEIGSMEVPAVLDEIHDLLIEAEVSARVFTRAVTAHPVPDASEFLDYVERVKDLTLRLGVYWTKAKSALRVRSWLFGMR